MRILLLGASGSIGTSACNCIRRFKDRFSLSGISVNTNISRLVELVDEFDVRSVNISCEKSALKAKDLLPKHIKIYTGVKGLWQLVEETNFDIMLNALVGAIGFQPTVAALQRNKRVALANKESLVIGGQLILQLLAQGCGQLIPVDSEHSAILQCLNGEASETIENIIITASGGPFRDCKKEDFAAITPQDALKHPTWSMGNKITIDSATLMNKGFELIEAHYLFSLPFSQLQVMIHPQSIVHSMVTFHDGAIIAQCGIPDMELPIQYALSFPHRLPINNKRLDLTEIGTLDFYRPDLIRFPCLKLCLEAGKTGGTLTTVLNAANEIAVHYFLQGKISFPQIVQIIEHALNQHRNELADSVEIIQEIDKQTRNNIVKYINRI